MSELEHPVAVYFDEFEIRHEILAKDLKDEEKFAAADKRVLYDASEQVLVKPRRGSVKRVLHFCLEAVPKRRVFSFENDDAHNRRVNRLLSQLQSLESWSLELKITHNPNGDDTCRTIAKYPAYTWDKEIHRIIDDSTIVRHDIFGQAKTVAMSTRRPWFAIEVVNTHFPEEAAFKAMIELSKQQPFIAIFDLTARHDMFVLVNQARGWLEISKWTFYIKDGAVWRNEALCKNVKSSADLKTEVDKLLKRWK